MELVVLSLLGVGLIAAALDGSGGRDDTEGPEAEPEPETPPNPDSETPDSETPDPDPPQDLLLDDGASVETGSGNDTVRGDDAGTIRTLGGDDVVDIASGDVAGGDGDDLVTVRDGADNQIRGGDGNDTLIGLQGAEMVYRGGAGDDLIRVTVDARDGGSLVDGGAGNDTLEVTAALQRTPSGAPVVVIGGAGEDTFDITLDPENGLDPNISSPGVTIRDFDPAQDRLEFEVPGGASYNGASVIANTEGGFTNLVLRYTDTIEGVDRPASIVIRLDGRADITLDDIVLRVT